MRGSLDVVPSCEVLGCDGLRVFKVEVVVVELADLVCMSRGRLLVFSGWESRDPGPDSGTVCSTIFPVPSDKMEPEENLLDIVGLGNDEFRVEGIGIDVVVLLLRETLGGIDAVIAGETSRDEVVAALSTEFVGR